MADERETLTYYLAKDVVCTAQLNSFGIMHIDGKYTGDINGNGTLIGGKFSEINSDIIVENAILAGYFNGTITATRKIAILHTAQIYGEITAPICDIENGARMQASVHICATGDVHAEN